MLFIYGFLTSWFIFGTIIYYVSFHTSQTTNWDDWFYWFVCFPLFIIAIPILKVYATIAKFWNEIVFKYKTEWKWELEKKFRKPY